MYFGSGRSFLLPHAGHGCGLIAASGDENSIRTVLEVLVSYMRSGSGVRTRRGSLGASVFQVWQNRLLAEDIVHPIASCPYVMPSNMQASKC